MGKLPQLLEEVEKIVLHRLVYKLETARKGIPVWNDQPAGTLVLSLLWEKCQSSDYNRDRSIHQGTEVVDKA